MCPPISDAPPIDAAALNCAGCVVASTFRIKVFAGMRERAVRLVLDTQYQKCLDPYGSVEAIDFATLDLFKYRRLPLLLGNITQAEAAAQVSAALRLEATIAFQLQISVRQTRPRFKQQDFTFADGDSGKFRLVIYHSIDKLIPATLRTRDETCRL